MTRATLFILALALCNPACRKPVDKDGKVITSGSYRLRTFPSGAKVWINGELKVEATPATLVLEEGTYTLKIQAKGAEAITKEIEIEAGEHKDMTFNIPKPPPATVSVYSDVLGASVRVNGYMRGRTPLHEKVTKPGPLDITVTTPDGVARSYRGKLEVSEKKRIEVFFKKSASDEDELTKLISEPRRPGRMTLGLNLPGAVFDEAGKKLGKTPLHNFEIAAGEHRLTLKTKDGRYAREVVVQIEPGKLATFRFRLGAEDLVEKKKK